MKIEFVNICSVGSAQYKKGAVADLSDDVANKIISAGNAIPVQEETSIVDRSVGLTEDTPKPKKRAKK